MPPTAPIPTGSPKEACSFIEMEQVLQGVQDNARMLSATRASFDRTRESLDRLEEIILALRIPERGDAA